MKNTGHLRFCTQYRIVSTCCMKLRSSVIRDLLSFAGKRNSGLRLLIIVLGTNFLRVLSPSSKSVASKEAQYIEMISRVE